MGVIEGSVPRGAGVITGPGADWYVNAVDGSDSASGNSWTQAFLTMSKAFTSLGSGDRVHFVGKIREQLTTPVQKFDVTIIGHGNRPRHADATPDGGVESAATWAAPALPTATTPLLKVLQQGWRIENFVMAGPTDAACVLLYRDGGAADDERDASHFEAHGIRFASGQDGVEQSGGCYNVGIFDCSLHDLTGYAFKHTAGASIAAPYRWQIKRNRIDSCANLLGTWDFSNTEVHDNVITDITTNLINTAGGNGDNTFLRNSFDIAAADFDPAGGVTGKAGEVWSNYLTDAIESGLPAD